MILGNRIVVETDNKAIVYLLEKPIDRLPLLIEMVAENACFRL